MEMERNESYRIWFKMVVAIVAESSSYLKKKLFLLLSFEIIITSNDENAHRDS